MSWHDDYYQESTPRKTDQGIKAKSKKGKFTKNWWANRWIKAMERLLDAGRLRRGKRYARQGQVLSIEETAGGISAKVQGSRRTPYRVQIDIRPLSDDQWDTVMTTLSSQAIFTAQLLSGEMPTEIETVFDEAGLSLFPDNKADLEIHCSCPDPASPCKHVAAVHFLLGERFDEDPFLLFRLRGRTAEQIMEAIRAANGTDQSEEIEPAIPLEETLEHFWEMPTKPPLSTNIKSPQTTTPILRRLGQPSFLDDDLIKILTPVYQAVTEAAIKTAFDDDTTPE